MSLHANTIVSPSLSVDGKPKAWPAAIVHHLSQAPSVTSNSLALTTYNNPASAFSNALQHARPTTCSLVVSDDSLLFFDGSVYRRVPLSVVNVSRSGFSPPPNADDALPFPFLAYASTFPLFAAHPVVTPLRADGQPADTGGGEVTKWGRYETEALNPAAATATYSTEGAVTLPVGRVLRSPDQLDTPLVNQVLLISVDVPAGGYTKETTVMEQKGVSSEGEFVTSISIGRNASVKIRLSGWVQDPVSNTRSVATKMYSVVPPALTTVLMNEELVRAKSTGIGTGVLDTADHWYTNESDRQAVGTTGTYISLKPPNGDFTVLGVLTQGWYKGPYFGAPSRIRSFEVHFNNNGTFEKAVSASTGMTTFVDNEADNTATTQNALQTSVTTDEIRIVGLTYAGANGGRVFSRVALKVAQVPSHVLIAGFVYHAMYYTDAEGRSSSSYTDQFGLRVAHCTSTETLYETSTENQPVADGSSADILHDSRDWAPNQGQEYHAIRLGDTLENENVSIREFRHIDTYPHVTHPRAKPDVAGNIAVMNTHFEDMMHMHRYRKG